jgi:hypothetical protein
MHWTSNSLQPVIGLGMEKGFSQPLTQAIGGQKCKSKLVVRAVFLHLSLFIATTHVCQTTWGFMGTPWSCHLQTYHVRIDGGAMDTLAILPTFEGSGYVYDHSFC